MSDEALKNDKAQAILKCENIIEQCTLKEPLLQNTIIDFSSSFLKRVEQADSSEEIEIAVTGLEGQVDSFLQSLKIDGDHQDAKIKAVSQVRLKVSEINTKTRQIYRDILEPLLLGIIREIQLAGSPEGVIAIRNSAFRQFDTYNKDLDFKITAGPWMIARNLDNNRTVLSAGEDPRGLLARIKLGFAKVDRTIGPYDPDAPYFQSYLNAQEILLACVNAALANEHEELDTSFKNFDRHMRRYTRRNFRLSIWASFFYVSFSMVLLGIMMPGMIPKFCFMEACIAYLERISALISSSTHPALKNFPDIANIIPCCLCGLSGAYISLIQKREDLEQDGSWIETLIIAFRRLTLGLIFAGLFFGITGGGLLLELFHENMYAMGVFSFLAGYAERFVPDLLERIQKKTMADVDKGEPQPENPLDNSEEPKRTLKKTAADGNKGEPQPEKPLDSTEEPQPIQPEVENPSPDDQPNKDEKTK